MELTWYINTVQHRDRGEKDTLEKQKLLIYFDVMQILMTFHFYSI